MASLATIGAAKPLDTGSRQVPLAGSWRCWSQRSFRTPGRADYFGEEGLLLASVPRFSLPRVLMVSPRCAHRCWRACLTIMPVPLGRQLRSNESWLLVQHRLAYLRDAASKVSPSYVTARNQPVSFHYVPRHEPPNVHQTSCLMVQTLSLATKSA